MKVLVDIPDNEATFGIKVLRSLSFVRKAKPMSIATAELWDDLKEAAEKVNTSTSVIGRYERDEMTPSIEAARKIAKILGTTVGYLLDETEQENLFKDPDMLKRLNEIEKMYKEDKNHILYAIDGLIKSVKIKNIAAL